MSEQQTIVSILDRGSSLLRRHLGDFSDADMLARPVPGANHAAWQLSHLLQTNAATLAAVAPAAKVAMPDSLGRFKRESSASDNAADFPTKDELLDTHEAIFKALGAAVAQMSSADLEKPAPEMFAKFAPTLGALALMVPLHTSMHVGQLQVIRRKLGRPVMF